jgi:hypothetical protein
MNDLTWLTEQSKDEIYTFNDVIHRASSYDSVINFQGYIYQHSRYFFSPLNQIYLYLIDDIASLAFFNKVFVRDGLLTLKLFFLRHPSPNGLQTKLIINSRFKKFVPRPWQENILFYNYKFDGQIKEKKKTLLIAYHLDSLHCPDEVLDKALNSISNESYDEILCLVTGMPKTSTLDFVDKNIFSKATITAKNIKIPFRTVALNEINPRVIANSNFLEINPYHFLFSDCFLRWFLLYNGATPINDEWLLNDNDAKKIHEAMVSPFHSVEISEPKKFPLMHDQMFDEIDFFKSEIVPSRNQSVNLCSDTYKRYVQSLVHSHAKNNQ